MKVDKAIILTIMALFVIASLVQPIGAEPQAHWTKKKVNAFMKKYNLGYDKHVDESLLTKTVQEYEKMAIDTAQYFGEKVDHITNEIKNRLEKQNSLTQHDIDDLISNIQHHLRQLELQGQLTGDKVDQALDMVKQKAASKKRMADSAWDTIKNEAKSFFMQARPRSFWQRLFSSPRTADEVKSSIDQWLDQVQKHLLDLKVMSDQQLDSVMEQLRQAVIKKNLFRLASPHWYERLYYRINLKAELTEFQLIRIKDTLEKEINAYKVFAWDYMARKLGSPSSLYERCYNKVIQSCLSWFQSTGPKELMNRPKGDLKQAITNRS